MKKLFITTIVIASMASFTSCKKAYSCECVTTYTDTTGTAITLTQVKSIDEKMKEKQAESTCNQSEDQMNYVNDDLNSDTNGIYEDLNTTCALK